MSQSVGEVLEFPQVVALVGRYLESPLGAAELEKLKPLPDREQAEAELALVAEAMALLRERDGKPPSGGFHGLHDVRAAAGRLVIEAAELEPLEIFHLLEALGRVGDIGSTLAAGRARRPRLAELADRLGEFRPLLAELSGKILPDGRLDDHASGALRRVRREIEQQKRAVEASLDRFLAAHSAEGVLQEEYVTIRNERLVVPIITGQKRRIDGVIHGTSSTGHTLFVEPLETIELNNQLVRLIEEETRETHRILREMTARLAGYGASIAASVAILGRLELLFARARFGLEFDAAIPAFSPPAAPRLHLRRARHPLLEDVLRRRRDSAAPASLTLDAARRVLVISGPNTGGKTVALKTVGLLAMMAQAALPAPAEEAEFPWFDQVLADIGDYQSIQESLSTFSAHVAAIRGMVESATKDSLVLIDEMGTATDPQEGGALAIAVVDHFLRAGAFTLVSTHLGALKIYGANTAGVLNASLGFDERTLAPTYRLEIGLPGKSAGLDIARRLGLPASLIERAQQALTSQDLEAAAFLQELHRRREQLQAAEAALAEKERQLARREKELEREYEKRQANKLRELERRLEAVLEKFRADSEQAIRKIAESPAGAKAAARLPRRAREEFDATVAETLDERRQGSIERAPVQLAEGALVRLRGVTAPGRLRRKIGDDRWEVEVGPLKMQVDSGEVVEVVSGATPPKLPQGVSFRPAARTGPQSLEINVIGATAEEARERVDKFLDTAVVAGTPRVRVIHGHGMGVLRKTLWQMFASHPHVEKYFQAEQREGGAGATVVELRIC